MRKLTWAIMGSIILLGYGCSRGSSVTTPTLEPEATGGAALLGTPMADGGLVTSPMGLFTFTVDPETSSADIELARSLAGSARLYELSIENFVTRDTVKIKSVDVSPTTVDLNILVTHPMPAPENLDGTPTATNRADLGAALRLLLLHDVETEVGNTYFADDDEPVILNSQIVANADGYYTPKGLLELPSNIKANTFPYLLVVDEAANDGIGNRVGVSGIAGTYGQGNYDSANGGWQRHNLGPDNTGWTGFGILHGGQQAALTMRLNRGDLSAGETFTFDAVLIAKYLDPRGGATTSEKRGNRLPTADADAAAFSYRMPYGALDLEAVRFIGETGGWRPNEASSTTISFSIRDWDAFASETVESNLLNEPNINYIQIGGSGFPAIWIDVPGYMSAPEEITESDRLDDDSQFGGDPTPDTGLPGDALVYSKSVTKNVGSGEVSGTAMGLLRVIDPEDANKSSFTEALTKDITPVAADRIPHVWTYQTVPLMVADPNGLPNGTGMFVGGNTAILSGSTVQAQVLTYTDAENNPGKFTVDYDISDGYFADFPEQTILTSDSFPVLMPASPALNNNSSVTTVSRVAEIRYTDNLHAPRSIYIPYTLSGNQPPSGSASLPFEEYVVGSNMALLLQNLTDAEGNPIYVSIDWEWDGTEAGFSPDPGYNRVTLQQALEMRTANNNPGNWLLGIRLIDDLHPSPEVITIPYKTVPPNTLPEAIFTTPENVMSATSTTVTAISFTDIDGDDVEVQIDWNGDGDYADAGETGFDPLLSAGTVFTSPILYNNTSASPLAPRTVNVRYTDNVAPHEWIETNAGQYILGGNRPPVISGAVALEESPLPPPNFFTVVANGATVTDPEGNPITYTLRSVPNSGSANNAAFTAFPKSGPTYNNPTVSTVNMTVYANDALHASTSGTPWPVVTGTLCPTYVANWTFDTSNDGWTPGFGGLPNTDATNWSQWTWCPVQTGQGSIAGSHWTTGPDSPGPCTNHPDDYGASLNNNIVSPSFSLAGLTKANLVWNASYNGRGGTTCHYRIYISIDNGTNWQQIYDYTKSSATKTNTTNQYLSLNSFIGNANVRVRYQLQDTLATDTWGASPYAGWSIDAVRVTGCP